MGIRFRRRIRLAPGLHMNVSGSGVSFSVGPRGASVTLGARGGPYANLGIPGTGIYMRQRLSGSTRGDSRSAASPSSTPGTTLPVEITIDDAGELVIRHDGGELLEPGLVELTRKRHRPEILDYLQRAATAADNAMTALSEIHRQTRAPTQRLHFEREAFKEEAPQSPELKTVGWLDRLLSGRRARIESENAAAMVAHEEAMAAWNARRDAHEAAQEKARDILERQILTDVDVMEDVLASRLEQLVWPAETEASFELRDGGTTLLIDVDLPEYEDMPAKTVSVSERFLRLTMKPLSDTRRRQFYARHIHGVAMRAIGEGFSVLPTVRQVTFAGYSQRTDAATGHINDDYLLAVRTDRAAWSAIAFDRLEAVDPTEAIGRLEHRRDLTRSGVVRAITPFVNG